MNSLLLAPTSVKVSLSRLRVVGFVAPAAVLLATRLASAETGTPTLELEPAPQKLGLSAATSYLGGAAGSGVALSSGLRLGLGTHVALSADIGYGVVSARSATQDRWWIMPAIAWAVNPAENVRLDVGAGLGLGSSSGYASLADYARGPFSPTWAFQLVPAARAHVMAAMPFGHGVDVFLRTETAALLLSGTQVGFRNGNPSPTPADTTWFDIGAGVQFRVL
jgi:hypothetical protein